MWGNAGTVPQSPPKNLKINRLSLVKGYEVWFAGGWWASPLISERKPLLPW